MQGVSLHVFVECTVCCLNSWLALMSSVLTVETVSHCFFLFLPVVSSPFVRVGSVLEILRNRLLAHLGN